MSEATLILPVFNGKNTILDCILSIQNQTFTDFECLIVNDGSTDKTLAIAEDAIANDKRFRIINKSHEGLSIARNTGIMQAKSPVIMYIDADDKADSKMLEKVMLYFDENDVDMVIFNAEPFNVDVPMFTYKAEQRYFNRKKCYGMQSGRDMLLEMMHNRDFVYAVFIQAIKSDKIKYKFYPYMRAQDELYTLQNLYLAKSVGHLNETLYYKSCRKSSVANSKHDMCFIWSRIRTLYELIAFIERRKIPEDDVKKIFYSVMKRNLDHLQYLLKHDQEYQHLECFQYMMR